jgi:hypothetical protein
MSSQNFTTGPDCDARNDWTAPRLVAISEANQADGGPVNFTYENFEVNNPVNNAPS